MTVCIAARCLPKGGIPLIVFCMDLMGSNDLSSGEVTWKFQAMHCGFSALLAGPVGTARELAGQCSVFLEDTMKAPASVLAGLRKGIGAYKHDFADNLIQSRLGISYQEFRKKGKVSLPDDLYRDLSWEIKTHSSDAELIVAGFLKGSPRLFKVSGDTAWACDDFAVIGTGTGLGEAALLSREHTYLYGLERTLYHVYEAKKLAEKAPYVGKKTWLLISYPNGRLEFVDPEYMKALDGLVEKFSVQKITSVVELPSKGFHGFNQVEK